MSCPQFYFFMRPALEVIQGNASLHLSELSKLVFARMNLSQAELEEVVGKRLRPKAFQRLTWALTYLRQAKLIESVEKGKNTITERGKSYLQKAPDPIRPNDLLEFIEYKTFLKGSKADQSETVTPPAQEETPLEVMTEASNQQQTELATVLLDQLKGVTSARFERIIVDLMLALGYGGPRLDAGETLGKSGDGGVDGIIRQDKLGLENIYLQAKRWPDNTVGTSEINQFIGALTTRGSSKGVLITTSTFTSSAKAIAKQTPMSASP